MRQQVRPGNRQPTPEQLARLKELSRQAQRRFQRPRTAKQATAQIRDLEILLRAPVDRPPAAQSPEPIKHGTLRQQLIRLKAAHYDLAGAVERDEPSSALDARRQQIEQMEARIDAALEGTTT